MEASCREEGFQLRRDANFLLNSDRCLTALGAPVVLARNYAGYASLGRPRQGRWGIGDKDETSFKMASAFLKDRRDICVPVELLASLIDENSKLCNSGRSWNMPDTVCSDLSWPGSCLENLCEGHPDATSDQPPLLVHTSGPQTSHLALLRPRPLHPGATAPRLPAGASGGNEGGGGEGGKDCLDSRAAAPLGLDPEAAAAAAAAAAVADTACGSVAIETEDRLALHAGPIRQISALAPRAGAPPKVFARCDYSATLVGACRIVDRLGNLAGKRRRAVAERRIQRAKVAAGMLIAANDAAAIARAQEEEDISPGGGVFDLNGFVEEERLVFSRRLTCAACSPFTPNHAAFLDEEFRLFHWRADSGAVAHGSGPLPLAGAPAALDHPRSEAAARRARNADVALDYGSHPRVLWIAGRHRAYRVDLRERPSPAALAPALDPGVYYAGYAASKQVIHGGSGRLGGRGQAPRVRSLAVGRRAAHDVFLAAGLHLANMDARFPRGVVARWDLPEEADQLRWLPGVPGEGPDAEEIILASARRSPGFYVNTWAADVPGWRGCQIRLGLDDTSPAASAARRPLTFSLPAPPLGEGETRSGGLLLAPMAEQGSGGTDADCRGDASIWFVHGTSAGDAYGQRVEMRRVGDGRREGREKGQDVRRIKRGGKKPEWATSRSALLSDRIQSMLPCGDVCLDPDTTLHPPARPETATTTKDYSAAAAASARETSEARDVVRGNADANDRQRGSASPARASATYDREGDSVHGERRTKSTSGASTIMSDSGGARGDGAKVSGIESNGRRGRRGRRRGEDGRQDDGSSDTSGDESHRGSDVDTVSLKRSEGRSRKGETRAGATRLPVDGPRNWRRSRCARINALGTESSPRGNEASDGRLECSGSSSDDGCPGSGGGGGGDGGRPALSQSVSKKRQRRNGPDTNGPAKSRGPFFGVDGNSRRVGKVEYFPVNAGALRAAAEQVPENALCGHRYLAPLVDLVSSAKRQLQASRSEARAGRSSSARAASTLAQRRESDFSDLRDRKDRVADFLLKPRTAEELLTFCRRNLGLKLPADPPDSPGTEVGDTDKREDSTDSILRRSGKLRGDKSRDRNPETSSAGLLGSSSSGVQGSKRPRMDDLKIADDVARTVLAWGRPFRKIETPWRAAAAGQSYSLMPPFLRPLPSVRTAVLYGARDLCRGEPSPLLRPGVVGAPLAVDVTVEDVRWLKDLWDA